MRKNSTSIWDILKLVVPLGVIGLLFLILPRVIEPSLSTVWLGLLDGIGIASIVACLLAIAVDWRLKKAILDDVVKASLGYVLPESLRPAMRWVYSQKIVCIRHDQTIEIMDNPNNPQNVIVKSTLHRSFKNLSNAPTNVDISLAVDEWFEDGGESEIIEMGYRINDKSIDLSSNKNRFGHGWKIDKQSVELSPDTIVDTWSKFQEIRGFNDVVSWFFKYATQEPLVTVKLSTATNLNYEVGFTYADDVGTKVVSLGQDTWKLPTTILPMQPITVRWWERDNEKEWVSKNK